MKSRDELETPIAETARGEGGYGPLCQASGLSKGILSGGWIIDKLVLRYSYMELLF